MKITASKQEGISRCFPILSLILLLSFPKLSIQGAANGLLLWFQAVLPALAPFMICTQTIAAFDGVALLIRPFYPVIKLLLGLSVSGSYVFLCGILCGYPLGAGLCASFFQGGKIDENEAAYLLSICNHPSPMFLAGYVSAQLGQQASLLLLVTCLYLPVFPLSLISRCYYSRQAPCRKENRWQPFSAQEQASFSLEALFLSTCETMVVICGYIMLFSIFSLWVKQIPIPSVFAACISGLLEMTTGVNQICSSFASGTAVLPVIMAVAFGGLSGILQTKSVIKSAGLSIRHYVLWKLIHTFLSGLFFILLSSYPLFQ